MYEFKQVREHFIFKLTIMWLENNLHKWVLALHAYEVELMKNEVGMVGQQWFH